MTVCHRHRIELDEQHECRICVREDEAKEYLAAQGVPVSLLHPGFVPFWVERGKSAEDISAIANGGAFTRRWL